MMIVQSFTYLKRAWIPIAPELLSEDALSLLRLMNNRLDGRGLLIEPADDLAGREIPVESTITHTERLIRHGFEYSRSRRFSKDEILHVIREGGAWGANDSVCAWLSKTLSRLNFAYPETKTVEAWQTMQDLAHDIRTRIITEKRRRDVALVERADEDREAFGYLDRACRRYRVRVPSNRSAMSEAAGAAWLNREAVAFRDWCARGSFRATTWATSGGGDNAPD